MTVMKWSWLRLGPTKKLHVKVRPLKLEGLVHDHDDGCGEKILVVEMKWRGPKSGLVPFHRASTCKRSYSTHKFLRKGEASIIEWDDEFESVCDFWAASNSKENSNTKSFVPWDVSFTVLYGEESKSRTELAVLGHVSLNIAELASTRMDMQIERELPIRLQINGVARAATLSIGVSFAEVRSSHDSDESPESNSDESPKNVAREVSLRAEPESSPTSETGSGSAVKTGLFSWKKRPLDFSLARSRRRRGSGPSIDKTNTNTDGVDINLVDSEKCNSEQRAGGCCSNWEVKEVVSRDGKSKLEANVFFASFDQRSAKAEGESACTALVAVIAHWLLSNQASVPTRRQFDCLITEGSTLWRKLCGNEAYTNAFPDYHFDLETVLKADVRPLGILHEKSYTGIFSPEKFDHLKGAMSFDDIWSEISSKTAGCYDPMIYIVSWNDHFFVLKVDADAYYIIDTLGERLFEGCNQAYILKFDDSSSMYEMGAKEEEGVSTDEMGKKERPAVEKLQAGEIICRGKECCGEFIKRFFAAIPLSELEEEEKKGTISAVSLFQRLQIDFHYCSSSSAASSCSSLTSTYSLFSEEESP